MGNKTGSVILLILFLCVSCARQGAIPNPDKFPPHLLSISSPNRNELHLRFDEVIDPVKVLKETYQILSPKDTAEIRFITASTDNSKILVFYTSPLLPSEYRLIGLATDNSNNASSINSRFTASERKDSIPPSINAFPKDTLTVFPYRVTLEANEPLDTSDGFKVIHLPTVSNISYYWRQNLKKLDINFKDSSLIKHPLYILIPQGIADFAGNKTRNGLAFFEYADSALELNRVFGRVESSSPSKGPILLLFKDHDSLFAATLTDSSGRFSTAIEKKTSVTIEAWADIDGDGFFEENGQLIYAGETDALNIITNIPVPPRSLEQLIQEKP